MAKSSQEMIREISPGRKKSRKRVATRETEIWKYVEQAIILEGTQTRNKEKFDELVREGCYIRDDTGQEIVIDSKDLIERDSEVDLVDEDDIDFETWENRKRSKKSNYQDDITLKSGSLVRKEEDAAILYDNSHELYELVVEGAQCKFSIPDWVAGYRPRNPRGKNASYTFNLKFAIFSAISKWLEKDRPEFLNGIKWLNLGPKDYDEVVSKRVTIIQESFLEVILDFLRKNTNIIRLNSSVLSRCVNTAKIVWPNGSLPVKDLFGENARMGWVTRSIMLFMQRHGHSTDVIINNYCNMKMPKGTAEKQKILNGNIDSMDVGQFIMYANIVAGTTWEKVLNSNFSIS